jgi:hypothetical protein
MYIYNEILYILVDWYCSKYGVMGIYMIPHKHEYWATIAHDHDYSHIIMSYINSWSCYENPQDSSYNSFHCVCNVPSITLCRQWWQELVSRRQVSQPNSACEVCCSLRPTHHHLNHSHHHRHLAELLLALFDHWSLSSLLSRISKSPFYPSRSALLK